MQFGDELFLCKGFFELTCEKHDVVFSKEIQMVYTYIGCF